MVGVPGIEPGTSSLSGTRSNQLSYTPKSGGNRVRTGDPELAKLVLCQLSYAPIEIADLQLPIADFNRKSSICNRQSTAGSPIPIHK